MITESPEPSLNNIKSRDINIIMGFFGPENARDVLCLVRVILSLFNSQSARYMARSPLEPLYSVHQEASHSGVYVVNHGLY